LKDDLHRLQISRVAQRTKDEERHAWIARSIYSQWLAQHLYVQDSPLVPWRLRLQDSDDRTVADGWDAPALQVTEIIEEFQAHLLTIFQEVQRCCPQTRASSRLKQPSQHLRSIYSKPLRLHVRNGQERQSRRRHP